MKHFGRLLFISLLAYVAMSCVGTRYLKEGEYLLYNQKIYFPDPEVKEGLESQIVQKPNSRIWFLPVAPYTFIYHIGLKKYDSAKYMTKKQAIEQKFNAKIAQAESAGKKTKAVNLRRKMEKKAGKQTRNLEEGNQLMRWGEPLAVFDSTQAEKSAHNMQNYLIANGWFRGQVNYQVNYENRLVTVNYLIQPGPRYHIDSIFYEVPDSSIMALIEASNSRTYLKKGNPYRQDDLSRERTRLDELLKNNGYFDFSRKYIQYRVDTTLGQHRAAVQLRILPPENYPHHKLFRIDSVTFVVESSLAEKENEKHYFSYKGITYSFHDKYYSEKVLNRRIHLRPGDLYSRENTLNSQRELAGLDMYKFVNINYDSTDGEFIANIFVSPLKRYQWTAEAGLSVTRALPGPFASLSLKQRNVFNTFGIFEINGNIGIEGVTAASNPNDVLASLEAGVGMRLLFPRFFIPLTDIQKSKLKFFNPKSEIKLSLQFTDRPEYVRNNFSITNAYTWQPEQHILNEFRLFEIALVRTSNMDPAYYERLKELEQNGNNLIQSFKPSFISNLRFTHSFNKNNYGRGFVNSSYFSMMLEPGGTLTNLWLQDYFEQDSLEIYAYVKFDVDYRKIKPVDKTKAWAFRIRSGIALPYGHNNLLPYEKYFFTGGSISNRAWKPRRLGPGSYNHLDENGQVSYQFEQQGEIILESSIEFRQKLIGFIHWAAFVDAGNIWTIRPDNSRPGAQFRFDSFYKEIAVGAGLGLRFDLSFFIFRIDASGKVIDPARPPGKRFILAPGFNDPPFNDPKRTEPLIFSVSIGYSF